MLDWIKTIWDYNYRAHHQMMDCVAQLSEADFKKEVEYSMGSVHRQVVHVMWAESVWFARINGLSRPEYTVDDYPTVQAIRKKWSDVEMQWQTYLDRLTEEELSASFDYVRGNDEETSSILRETLWHVVNHGTDHRAQILQLCHSYGAPTFEQDMFFYFQARDGIEKKIITLLCCGRIAIRPYITNNYNWLAISAATRALLMSNA
ncbi:MAG: DinB family protein [Anaerolineae bacterium]|nr:DinB family protein [Anaerolineae bacterium]